MTVARAFGGALRMHLALYGLRVSRLLSSLLTPCVMAAVGALLLGPAAPGDALARVLLGGGLVGMWSAVLGTAAFTLRRENDWYGTFALLVAAPVRTSVVYAGYLLGETVVALSGVAAGIAVAWLLLGHLDLPLTPALAISLLVAAITIAALGLVFAAPMILLPILTRWINALDYPVWILAGLMFPIALLPAWSRPLSLALAPYWAAESVSTAARGAPIGAVAPQWLAALGLAVAYGAIAIAAFELVLRRARATGSLVRG